MARRKRKMVTEVSEILDGQVSEVQSSVNGEQNINFFPMERDIVVRDASPDLSSRRKHTADEAGLPDTNNFNGPSGEVSPLKKRKPDKNPVSQLNELHPGLEYKIVQQSGPSHAPLFRVSITVDGVVYEGEGKSKKSAKCNAAENFFYENNPSPRSESVAPEEDFTVDSPQSCSSLQSETVPASERSDSPAQTNGHSSRRKKNDEPKVPKAPPATTNKNPIMLLNELRQGVIYTLIHESGDPHAKTFRYSVSIDDFVYDGTGSSKKLAKAAAAKQALSSLFGLMSTGTNIMHAFNSSSSFHLDQGLADRIAAAVSAKFDEITAGNVNAAKKKVISGFVLTNTEDESFLKVINVSSGTKCINGQRMSLSGYTVNDCHAEIVSRRCLLSFLYTHLESIAGATTLCGEPLTTLAEGEECIFERRPNGPGYRLKDKFKINLYINTAPCGDARIFAPHEDDSKKDDKHPNRHSRGLLRTKIESGEGTIPIKFQIGAQPIQTWDGVLQGERLRTMSCSDKIAKWNVVGLQGALLAHFIEPVYAHSIILGSLFNATHIYRALVGRIESYVSNLPEGYNFNIPKMNQGSSTVTRYPTKAPSISLNWDVYNDQCEILNALTGRPDGDEKGSSRLSKLSLYKRFSNILLHIEPMTAVKVDDVFDRTYKAVKYMSLPYQEARVSAMKAFDNACLGKWVCKCYDMNNWSLSKAYMRDLKGEAASDEEDS